MREATVQFYEVRSPRAMMIRTTLRILGSIAQGKVTKYNYSIVRNFTYSTTSTIAITVER